MAFKLPLASVRLKNARGRAVVECQAAAGLYAWSEVFLDGRWINLDQLAGLVDAANEKKIGLAIRLLESLAQRKATAENSWIRSAAKRARVDPAYALLRSSLRGTKAMVDVRSSSRGAKAAVKPRGRAQPRAASRYGSLSRVAVCEEAMVMDITRRYASGWEGVQSQRPPSWYFEKTIAKCSRVLSANGRKKIAHVILSADAS